MDEFINVEETIEDKRAYIKGIVDDVDDPDTLDKIAIIFMQLFRLN